MSREYRFDPPTDFIELEPCIEDHGYEEYQAQQWNYTDEELVEKYYEYCEIEPESYYLSSNREMFL